MANENMNIIGAGARHGWDVWGNEVPCSIELGAQNIMEICHTAPNSGRDAMQQVEMGL